MQWAGRFDSRSNMSAASALMRWSMTSRSCAFSVVFPVSSVFGSNVAAAVVAVWTLHRVIAYRDCIPNSHYSQIYLSPAVLIVAANPSLHTWHSSQQHASVSASQQRHSATKGWYGMIESKATIIPVSGNLAILSPGEIVNLNLNPWLYLTHVSNPGLHLWLSINIIFQSMSSDSYMIYVKQNVFY